MKSKENPQILLANLIGWHRWQVVIFLLACSRGEHYVDPANRCQRDSGSSISSERSVLTAITGIDASGKGYFTERLVDALQTSGLCAVAINVDAWLNLPNVRFDASNPPEHYYHNAIRFEEMFAQTILPLRDHRSLCIEINYADETATEYRRRIFEFEDVDVIALEGIYLLKRAFQAHYDRSIWVECSFETRWSAPYQEHRKVYRLRRPFKTTGPYIFPHKRFTSSGITPKG